MSSSAMLLLNTSSAAGDGSFTGVLLLAANLPTSLALFPVVLLLNCCDLGLEPGGGAGFAGIGDKSIPPILDEEVRGLCSNDDWSSWNDSR